MLTASAAAHGRAAAVASLGGIRPLSCRDSTLPWAARWQGIVSLTFSHDGTKLLTMGQDANHRIVMCVYLLGACALCHSHMRMRNRCYVPAASRAAVGCLPQPSTGHRLSGLGA